MIISTEKRFIFAAFNKTGTSSIESVLDPYNDTLKYYYLYVRYKWLMQGPRLFKHVRPFYLKQIVGNEEWEKYFSFSFVRNPWSRAVSLYFYHRKQPSRRPLAQKSFEDWLLGGGTGTAHRSMFEFISDDDGNIIVDFVGRYENLADDFREACAQADLPSLELPHLRQSTSGDYRKHYNDEMRDIVAEWSRVDIEKFGYDF